MKNDDSEGKYPYFFGRSVSYENCAAGSFSLGFILNQVHENISYYEQCFGFIAVLSKKRTRSMEKESC